MSFFSFLFFFFVLFLVLVCVVVLGSKSGKAWVGKVGGMDGVGR